MTYHQEEEEACKRMMKTQLLRHAMQQLGFRSGG